MKKAISLFIVFALCLSLCACGSTKNPDHEYVLSLMERGDYDMAISVLEKLRDQASGGASADTGEETPNIPPTDPPVDATQEAPTDTAAAPANLTAEQQLVADAVAEVLHSGDFAAWQSLYTQFTGSDPRVPQVTNVIRYQNGDFDGEETDCYLINVSADVAYWVDEGASMGGMLDQLQIFVDTNTRTVYDSVSTDAANFDGNLSTSKGRAVYLLWQYNSLMLGQNSGPFVNSAEIITELTEADISAISAALSQ